MKALRGILDGEVLEPGDTGYDLVRIPAQVRFGDIRPRAVVRCASTDDVVRTVRHARESDVRVVPRGGGHCFAGRSSTEGVLLDLSKMCGVSVRSDGTAAIGAGTRLAEVYADLHRHALTLPAGCGATVGIAGLTLGGGLGLLGRVHGLTSDRLIRATIVLADGRIVTCDEHIDPDLFWALRGAGGGQFGVVTELVFAPVPEPRACAFQLTFAPERAVDVVAGWQEWAPDAPYEMTANLQITAVHGSPMRVVAFGAATLPRDVTTGLLDHLRVATGASVTTSIQDQAPYTEVKAALSGLDSHDEPTWSRSEFFAQPIPRRTITDLMDRFACGLEGGVRRELNFMVMGGAYNCVPADATGFVHRDERFLLEHVAVGGNDPWLDESWAIVHEHASGRVYPNFPDPRLTDPARAYHGTNLDRLTRVKHAYDPDRFFSFPQAI